MTSLGQNLQPISNPLQINLPGYEVKRVRGYGLQQVLSDGQRLYCGRIYPVKQFNRIIATYRALKDCDKHWIARLHLARYASPSFGIIVTPKHSRVTFEQARQNIKPFVQSLLIALYCCHSRHFVHRNVNFDSVVRSPSDEAGKFTFLLTNFKYAICTSDPAFGRPKGAMRYRAPEALGKSVPKKAGTAIDIWSVGTMFLELLLNQPGWNAYPDPELSKEMILMQTDEDVESLCRREIKDKDAADLLQKMLRMDYRQRISAKVALKHNYFKN